MKIRTSVHLALAAAVATVVALALAAFLFFHTIRPSMERQEAIFELVQGVAELHIRTAEYLSRPEPRPLAQWEARDAAVQALLAGMPANDASTRLSLQSMLGRHQEIRRLFHRLVQQQEDSSGSELARAGQAHLLRQLFVKFEEQLAEAKDVRRVSVADEFAGRLRAALVLAAVVTLLLGAVLLSVWTVRRSLSAPLARLLAATQAIGAGELQHRINDGSATEMGELSRALDAMAQRLQEVTTSREALRQAQAALRDGEQRLALALRASNASAWELDLPSGRLSMDGTTLGRLGYAADAVTTSAQWVALMHEDDRPVVLENMRALVKGLRDSYHFEFRLRAREGNWCWILTHAVVAERDLSGRALRLVGAHTLVDERKRSELERERLLREVQQQRALLQSVIDNTPAGVAIFEGPQHRYVLVNDAQAAIAAGQRPLVGRTVGEAGLGGGHGAQQFLDRVYQSGEPVHCREIHMVIEGAGGRREAYFNLDYLPLKDDHGLVDGVLLFSHDITEQVQARQRIEQLAHESQVHVSKLDGMFRSLTEGVVVFDLAGNVLDVNPAATAMIRDLGIDGPRISLPQLVSAVQLLDGAGKPIEQDNWPVQRVLRGERFAEMEVRWKALRGDGELVLGCSGTLVHDAAGKPVQGVVTLRDLTARRRSEEQLRLAAQALENAAEGVLISRQGRIVSVNRAFCVITGYGPEEVLGEPVQLLHSGSFDRSHLAERREAVTASGVWQGEIWGRRKDGEIYPVWVSLSAVDDPIRGRHYVSVFSDISATKAAEERLEYLAHHDVLTSLPNRTLMHERFNDMLVRAQRNSTAVAVLYIDLDHFKPVNDSLGHEVGDLLLQAVAQRMTGGVRKSDLVSRVGGDEFVVLLEELRDIEEVSWIAQSIADALARPFHCAAHQIYISASIGIACYPQDGKTVETLLRHADTAMYKAKEDGKNRYRFFSRGMDKNARERLFLTTGLRTALDRGELALAYQPRISTASGRLIGVEALVRWHSPEHGLILPSRFIGIAEETGIIEPLGEWVLRTACGQLRLWKAAGEAPGFVSANLSARQFSQPKLAERLAAILQEAGIEPGELELEITESVVMANPEKAKKTLRRLADLGVRLSLDDFGTGHSSLAYLQRFPVHHLKVDRSFVQELPGNRESANITRAIVAMARSLELGVTAEGVETEAQRQFLADAGCEAWQGYLFSEPVAAEELRHFLKTDQGSDDRRELM